MRKDDLELVRTKDGSDTLLSNRFSAHYHSTYGAIQESRHVFIKHGLEYFVKLSPAFEEVKILEYGFGTGLNTLLSLSYARQTNLPIYYHALEAYPVEPNLLMRSNLGRLTGLDAAFHSIIRCKWQSPIEIDSGFTLIKDKTLFEEFVANERFHIVYFDAFGPLVQPDLWKLPMMQKIFSQLIKGGILVTFCAKGSFKRTLRSVGFEVERLPGPPGKREMTRAIKP